MDDHVLALEVSLPSSPMAASTSRLPSLTFYRLRSLPDRGRKPIQVLDPVNFDNNVAEHYEDADRTALETAAARAYDTISTAHYEPVPDDAEELWQAIMGRTFRRAS